MTEQYVSKLCNRMSFVVLSMIFWATTDQTEAAGPRKEKKKRKGGGINKKTSCSGCREEVGRSRSEQRAQDAALALQISCAVTYSTIHRHTLS